MVKPRFYDVNGHTVYGVPNATEKGICVSSIETCEATLPMNNGYIECDVTGKHLLHGANFGKERIEWSIIR